MGGAADADRDKADPDVEALMDGVGDGPLHMLLLAARAPGTAAELTGEDAALRAFRLAATSARPAEARRRPRRARVLRRFIAVNVAVLAALVMSGVALAAGGVIPLPFTEDPRVVESSSQPGYNPRPTQLPPAGPTGQRVVPTATSPHLGSPPSAAIPGLCHAYLAYVAAHRAGPWNDPAAAVLRNAAGGEDKMEAFCIAIVEVDKGADKDGPKAENKGKPGDLGPADEKKTKPVRPDEPVPVDPRMPKPKPS